MVFRPGDGDLGLSDYNLWRGWAIEPDPSGSCKLFLKHLLEVVCGGEREHYEWLLDWMAHLFQHPGVKPGIAVALKGGQGAGKSIVGAVLKKLLGKHQVIADKSDQVTGRFNGHLAHCLLLQAEEAFWGGDKDTGGALKHLVTGEHFRIERKGIDSVEMENFTRLLITSNEDWVWPTSLDDRRLAIFEVSNEYVGEDLYFEIMVMQLEELGGYQKLLHTLLERKLPSSRLRNPPTTAALQAQAAESMPGEEVWLFNLLSNGEIQGRVEDDGRAYVPIAVLYDDYCASIPKGAFKKSSIAFANFLQDKLQAKNMRRRPRVDTFFRSQVRSFEYQIPPLSEARARYSQRGRAATQEWDEPNHWLPVGPNGLPPVEAGALENPDPDAGK